jgi:Spy/CpxP family protein refolding chaperone
MTKPKIIRIETVLAAVAIVAALWPLQAGGQAQKPAQDKPQTQSQERASLRRDMIKDLLNVTPEQEKKIQEFRQARQKDRQAFRDEMTRMRGEMRDLMKDTKANAAKIDGLIDGMSKLRADREKIAVRTRGEWEKLFTPEQLEKMKKYRGAFMGRQGLAERGRFGLGRPGMGRFMGMRGMGMGARRAWGWRMHRLGRFWHRAFFGPGW